MMLHKIDVGDDNVVGFRWEGKYDEKGVKQSFVQFLPELQSRSEMNLYLEVGSLTEVEAKAIWEEIRFDIKNLQQIVNKIEKVSLVTDMNWMRTMAETSSSLVPGIRLKAFSFKETDAARAFVTA